MPSLDIIRADPHPEVRPGMFGTLKNDIIAAVGEFIGTITFLIFALGATQTVVQPPKADGEVDLAYVVMSNFYIAAAFGFSLYASASIFYRFTGSIFDPSVGLALWLSGVIGPVRLVLTAFAQILGGIVAAGIVHGLTPGGLGVNNRLSPGVSSGRGLVLEMFGTAALTLSVLMLTAEKHNMTPMAPLGIGLMLFVVELYTVPLTGGAINTARAFGPDVVSGDFPSYHWIYWLGPTLGALVATAFYYILKTIGYWRISPGQDTVDVRESALNDLHTSRSNDSRRATSSLSFSRVGSPQAAAGSGAGLFGGRGRTRGNSGSAVGRTSDATYSSRNQGGHPRSPTVQDGEKLGRPILSPV